MTHLLINSDRRFWPSNGPTVMLGPWCKLGEELLKTDNQNVVPNPRKNFDQIMSDWQFVQETYEDFLGTISQVLNKIHGTHTSKESWRIIIGPWLSIFIEVVYDRYSRLKLAQETYSELKFTFYSETYPQFIHDTDMFFELARYSDDYNNRLISKIAQLLGITEANRIDIRSAFPFATHHAPAEQEKNPLQFVHKTMNRLMKRTRRVASTILVSSYLPRKETYKIYFKSLGKVNFIDDLHLSDLCSGFKPRPSCRRLLNAELLKINPKNLFSKILLNLITVELPLNFLEGFKEMQKFTDDFISSKIYSNIGSASSWITLDIFKFWAAKQKSCGAKLIGIQHGGDYGVLQPMHWENHELKICDKYLTWGWSQKEKSAQVHPNFVANSVIPKKEPFSGAGFLYVATRFTKYSLLLSRPPELLKSYLEWQKSFVERLAPKYLDRFTFRLYRDKDYKHMKSFLESISLKLRFSEQGKSLLEELYNSQIAVFDHLSTGYSISLAINQPTIIFWNDYSYNLRPEAQKAFELLEEAKIFHRSPASAAEWLEYVANDLAEWWCSQRCRKAQQFFSTTYGPLCERDSKEWIEILTGSSL